VDTVEIRVEIDRDALTSLQVAIASGWEVEGIIKWLEELENVVILDSLLRSLLLGIATHGINNDGGE
jgi:hypothetical protein